MLFALIATDEDVQRFSTELQAVLSSIPTAHAVTSPAPVEQKTSDASAPVQQQKTNGADAAARAREIRSLYSQFKKTNGRPPTDAEKAAIKAGQDPRVGTAGQPVAAVQPTLPTPEPAPAVDVEALLAEMRAKLTGQPAPAAAPAAAPPGQPVAAKRFDSLPQQRQLPQHVCQGLREWAANLTPLRQQIVTAYANGQAGPADVHAVYGEKASKVLAKVNQLVTS